jgi:hypothetical protein
MLFKCLRSWQNWRSEISSSLSRAAADDSLIPQLTKWKGKLIPWVVKQRWTEALQSRRWIQMALLVGSKDCRHILPLSPRGQNTSLDNAEPSVSFWITNAQLFYSFLVITCVLSIFFCRWRGNWIMYFRLMQNASKFWIPSVDLNSVELDYAIKLLTASATQHEGV